MHLLGSLAAHDRISVVIAPETGRFRLRLGGLTVHLSPDQARELTTELMSIVPAPDYWPDPEPQPRRFANQHGVAVASIAPGDWCLRGADEDDWGQVAAKVRGNVDSDFTFHDGVQLTWPNRALVTIGKPVDDCGAGVRAVIEP